MKKKFIALFAACSMITTAVAGLVQTAYADDVGVRVNVSEGSSDNEKVLTFYYEGVDSLISIQGYFDLWDDDDNNLVDDIGSVTVDSFDLTVEPQYFEADAEYRSFYATESRKNRTISSDDHSFATATITVPGDIDITLELVIEKFRDGAGDNHSIDTVYVTIPKNEVTPSVPVVDKEVVAAQAFTTPDYDKDMVVGIFDLNVTGANYDLSGVTYNGKPGAVTGETSVFGPVRITVIINGATSTDELNQVAFE